MNHLEHCMEELGCAIVPITGTSMCPLLKEGKALVEVVPIHQKTLQIGDVVLYRKSDGTLVLHRIIKAEAENRFTVLGDHQYQNAERVCREQIIAVAKGFWINGRFVDEQTRWYRIYKKIWLGSMTVRRCCLALFGHSK